MDLNQLTINVRGLEQELLEFVNVDSLAKIKCELFNNYDLTDESQIINLLITYSNKLKEQLLSKTSDNNKVIPLVKKCTYCERTELLGVWGDWGFNGVVRFTSGYCNDECFFNTYPELREEWKTI